MRTAPYTLTVRELIAELEALTERMGLGTDELEVRVRDADEDGWLHDRQIRSVRLRSGLWGSSVILTLEDTAS